MLGVSALADAYLVAGRCGLQRVIQRLNVMEVPDILAWVKSNELLLTTGYPLRNTPQSLAQLVAPFPRREAYDQAVRSVRVGRQLHGSGALAHFDKLGVYGLLSLVPDTAELHAFVRESLGELATGEDPETVDLRRTLHVLLETNLNVAETARRLHFHYNTLRYRIGKLERILGPFTQDAHLRLTLDLALHVVRMRGI